MKLIDLLKEAWATQDDQPTQDQRDADASGEADERHKIEQQDEREYNRLKDQQKRLKMDIKNAQSPSDKKAAENKLTDLETKLKTYN